MAKRADKPAEEADVQLWLIEHGGAPSVTTHGGNVYGISSLTDAT